jgi:hypothetical protein
MRVREYQTTPHPLSSFISAHLPPKAFGTLHFTRRDRSGLRYDLPSSHRNMG